MQSDFDIQMKRFFKSGGSIAVLEPGKIRAKTFRAKAGNSAPTFSSSAPNRRVAISGIFRLGGK